MGLPTSDKTISNRAINRKKIHISSLCGRGMLAILCYRKKKFKTYPQVYKICVYVMSVAHGCVSTNNLIDNFKRVLQ